VVSIYIQVLREVRSEQAQPMNRKNCPNCHARTEFVQFGGADSRVTLTDPKEVGDGLLELRLCNECTTEVENVLNVESRNSEQYNEQD
jgi:hypothetical protein